MFKNYKKELDALNVKYLDVKKDYADLITEYRTLKASSTPENVIKEILKKGIEWYDYKDLSESDRISYANKAKDLLRNDVFNNELNAFVSDLVNEIAYTACSEDIVNKLRYSINGVETLKERIERIAMPPKEKDAEDPFEGI